MSEAIDAGGNDDEGMTSLVEERSHRGTKASAMRIVGLVIAAGSMVARSAL